jgi:predicted dehydrogenase
MTSKRELAFGVVGLGFGANHARVLNQLPGVRLAAVCDPDETRLEAATSGRDARPYRDHETMLRQEPLDAVVVAVPARLHEPVALAALAAGCAVLVEKPLAPSLAEGVRIVKAATDAGLGLMPGHIERFNPAVQELARRVQAGEIGRVLQLTARRMGAIVVRAQDVNVIHDSAIHDIDIMRYLLGAEVERVFAEARSDLSMPFEDSVTALLRFAPTSAAAGATATLDVNWLAPQRLRDLTVRGTEGLFILDYAAQTLELLPAHAPLQRAGARGWQRSPGGGEVIHIAVEPREPLLQELRAFAAAVRDGTPLPITAGDGLAALAVCDALTQSARSGQPVAPSQP